MLFVIDMLTEWSGDVTGWIDWFVYEKECGKKKLEVRDTDGTIVSSDNPEDIWNLNISTRNPISFS